MKVIFSYAKEILNRKVDLKKYIRVLSHLDRRFCQRDFFP